MLRLHFTLQTGLEICLGKPLDDTLLHLVHNEVQNLYHSLDVYREKEDKDVESVCSTLALLKSEFHRSIVALEEERSSLQKTCEDLNLRQDEIKEEMAVKDKEQKQLLRTSELHWQMRQEQVESICKTVEIRRADMERDLDVLRTKVDSLSFSKDTKEVVFDAPEENKCFTGREKEVNILEWCLPIERDTGLQMAAICGLGGCGKTTLATHFAWKRKAEYDGGVFWVSMEDDRKFENSMNDLALRLGTLADSFDLTLSKVLEYICQQKKPWLFVLDDVDQLNLSEQMRKVLSGRWKRQAKGHLLLTTRREPREVCESLNIEPSCCVEIFSFSPDEAKKFLVSRSGIDNTAGQEEALNALVHELGCLPLALEQAGAHMKALQCPMSTYLEGYKRQRLQLLSRHPAKPSWEYESQSRLAVHTTWLMNFEYVRNSPYGEVASSFVQASAFLEPHEIQEELINPELLSDENPSGQSISFPFAKTQIMEILTKFSLFQRKSTNSLSLHRLVQEVVRNRMTIEENSLALLRAVRLLHRSFHDCPSPDEILTDVVESVQEQASASVADPSRFYLWSKFTSHASELQHHVKSLLDKPGIEREVKALVLTNETSRVVYENALKLSVHGHQEEAKEAERLAFQILDAGTSDCVALSLEQLRNLFPHALPLSQMAQKIIFYSSRPISENRKFESFENDHCGTANVDDIRLKGNKLFKGERFQEAVDTYTEAIEASKKTKMPDARLLNNRATAYLKLEKFEECLQDSEEYIHMMPTCWKGYTRKALALNGLGRKLPALYYAAMAYYCDAKCCHRYLPFYNVFKDLDGNWEAVESSEALQRCLIGNKTKSSRKKVVLLTAKEYVIPDVPYSKHPTDAHDNPRYTLYLGSSDILGTILAAFGRDPDVTISCGAIRFREDCFVENISFSAKLSVKVAPNGNVEFTKCKFTSTSSFESALTVQGTAVFIECAVKDSQGGGLTVEGVGSSASVIKSQVSGNGKDPLYSSGIKVFYDGRLNVNECLIYGNTEGIHVYGSKEGSLAKGAIIANSEIYDNKFQGVYVSGHPSCFSEVIIRKNKIFHNGGYGVNVSFHVNNILLEENLIFKNFWWGVWVQCNSGGCFKGNEICDNNMGGIRVGKQSPGKPACLLENNIIHDNCGPAVFEGLRLFESYSFPDEFKVHFITHEEEKALKGAMGLSWDYDLTFTNAVSAELKNNQCFQNDKNQTNVQAATSNTRCAFCFRRDIQLKSCQRCMTARYCGKKCQKLHWGRHKYMCQAAGEINATEVPIELFQLKVPRGITGVVICRTHPSLEPTGPRYASPPPKDGRRFVVKLQTWEGLQCNKFLDSRGYVSDEYDPNKATISVYDRSRHLDFRIVGKPRIYHLIMECGMMGASMFLAKKLFCWAAYKDSETLRIFTHEFPPVQKW